MSCGVIHEINLSIAAGDDKSFLFTAYDEDGELLDISGASQITFIIARRSGAVLLEKVIGAGVLINNANQFTVEITDFDSADLPVGVLYCEAHLVNATGKKYTIGAGPFTVARSIIGGGA